MDRKRKAIIAGNQVSRLSTYQLGGYEQKVLLDGKSEKNPILIFLHGGPGTPIPFSAGSRGMFPQFTKQCILVCWDQLGCGINNHNIDDSFTVEQFVDMTVDLIRAVKKEFPDNPVNLFGVSWGSVLAAKAAVRVPELLNRVLVYGQVLKKLTFNADVYDVLAQADVSARVRMRIENLFGKEEHTAADLKQAAGWIRKYTEGYQVRKGSNLPIGKVIGGLLASPDYSLKDVKAIVLNGYLHNQSLLNEMMEIDLSQELRQVQVPYLIMQGDRDIVTPTKAVERLMTEEHTDKLFFSLVENSAHMPSANAMERIQTEGISFLKKEGYAE